MRALSFSLRQAGTAFAQDARAAYEEGLRAQATEDYALAVEKFKEALSANPAYVGAHGRAGAILSPHGGVRRSISLRGHGARE